MESLNINTRKSQLPKISLLLAFLSLLTLIPFISPPMRFYFLLNLLIMVLAIEAGFLSSSSSNPARDDHKKPVLVVPASQSTITTTTTSSTTRGSETSMKSRPILMKRCKSRPSLFFIGGTYEEEEDYEEKKVEVDVEVELVKKREVEEIIMMSKQELFMKAEVFIGNFYKQLNMQRNKSWNKLHGLYHN